MAGRTVAKHSGSQGWRINPVQRRIKPGPGCTRGSKFRKLRTFTGMKRIYHLATCRTCQRILAEWNPSDDVEIRELKSRPINESELKELYSRSGSYESLFNRRSQLYRKYGLSEKALTEEDYRDYILEHYTFLKRPVLVVNDRIFIGNAKKVVEEGKEALQA